VGFHRPLSRHRIVYGAADSSSLRGNVDIRTLPEPFGDSVAAAITAGHVRDHRVGEGTWRRRTRGRHGYRRRILDLRADQFERHLSLASLPTSTARLRFTKDGYEVTEINATQTDGQAALQRIIRVSVGETVSPPRFAPNDLIYTVGGERCVTCRLLRLVAPAAGTLHVRVAWNEPRVILSLWANGSVIEGSTTELVADLPVRGGESIVYLSLKPAGTSGGFHVPFTIESSMR
jgi:hypothetical protein